MVIALGLALLLSVSWAARDWAMLRRMVLPDPDDMMRLAQVRDWLAGQATNDWTQYRMAPPHGAPMHWSRINDAPIAATILAATPLLGRAGAELLAVLLYPAMLFALSIFMSARIAAGLWGQRAAPVAAVLAAIGYPGVTIFVPGRIDHHGLQAVLIEGAILALMAPPRALTAAAAGVAVATSLLIGLETAPQLAALTGVLFAFWVSRGGIERTRLTAFAGALAVTTLAALAFLRPTLWTAAFCDSFTPASATGTLAAAGALVALAAATPVLTSWRSRMLVGGALGMVALGATLCAFPACVTGPYGAVDPFLRREFIPHIEEANSLFLLPFAKAFSIGGVVIAGMMAAAWMAWRRPAQWPLWSPIVAVLGISGLIMFVQVRGAYFGAPAAAPVLAGLVLAARRRTTRRTWAVLGAWLFSAGLFYLETPVLAIKLLYRGGPTPFDKDPQRDCLSGDVFAQLDRYPPGLAMAPTYMASYSLGGSHLSTVGAGYHRNNAGNMAMYRYFLGPPERSKVIAHAWGVRYVLFCPGDFGEMDAFRRFPRSLAARLEANQPPPGFTRLPLRGTALHFYRLEP